MNLQGDASPKPYFVGNEIVNPGNGNSGSKVPLLPSMADLTQGKLGRASSNIVGSFRTAEGDSRPSSDTMGKEEFSNTGIPTELLLLRHKLSPVPIIPDTPNDISAENALANMNMHRFEDYDNDDDKSNEQDEDDDEGGKGGGVNEHIGRWTQAEHDRFIQGLKLYGKVRTIQSSSRGV